jgi:hypothetical protein
VLEQTVVAVAVIMAGISNDAVQGHRLINNNNNTALNNKNKKTCEQIPCEHGACCLQHLPDKDLGNVRNH